MAQEFNVMDAVDADKIRCLIHDCLAQPITKLVHDARESALDPADIFLSVADFMATALVGIGSDLDVWPHPPKLFEMMLAAYNRGALDLLALREAKH